MWTYGGRGLRFLCGHLEVVGLGDLHRLHIRIATSMNYSNVIFTVKPDKESKLLVTVRQTPRKPTKERLSIYLCVLLKFLRRFWSEERGEGRCSRLKPLALAKPKTVFVGLQCDILYRHKTMLWGVGGALVESTPFVRRVAGSTPALAAT